MDKLVNEIALASELADSRVRESWNEDTHGPLIVDDKEMDVDDKEMDSTCYSEKGQVAFEAYYTHYLDVIARNSYSNTKNR